MKNMNTTVEIAKVALSYGKIINRGYLTRVDLMVLTEAGLPIVSLLADKYTELYGEFVSVSDVFEGISNGLVSANMISEILKDLTIKTTDNMNTTLELPEGSKATIQGKVIDGKYYLVVEVGNEEQKLKTFSAGDFVVLDEKWISIYKGRGTSEACISDYCGCWIKHECYNILGVHDGLDYRSVDNSIRLATEEEKQILLDMLAKKGLMWDGEKLVEVLKEGDMAIFWDHDPSFALIAVYRHFVEGSYVDHMDFYWANALKWDGTKEQYEKVLRGEL